MVFKHLDICVLLFQLSFNYISNAMLYDLQILATFGSICYSMFIKKKIVIAWNLYIFHFGFRPNCPLKGIVILHGYIYIYIYATKIQGDFTFRLELT